MTEKRFWCLEEYEGETSPIVDGKFAPTNGWLCNRLNELYEENEQLKEIFIEQLESALTIPFIRKEYCNALLRILDEEDSLESAKEYIKNFLGASE